MNIDFLPVFQPYKHTGKFRFWCQKVLPTVYDDSLSYYELLCKVVNYLNDVIENLDKVEENLDALRDSFGELQTWVSEQIDAMLEDIAQFKDYVQGEIDGMNDDIEAFKSQMTDDFDQFKNEMADDFDEFKSDVNTILSNFETRFTQLSNSLSQQFTALSTSINNQFTTLQTELEEDIDTKIDAAIDAMSEALVPVAQEAAQDAVDELVSEFETRVSTLESEYTSLTSSVQTLEGYADTSRQTMTNLIKNGNFSSVGGKSQFGTIINGGVAEPYDWNAGVFALNDDKLIFGQSRVSSSLSYFISGFYVILNFNALSSAQRFALISNDIIDSAYSAGPPILSSQVIFKGSIKFWGTSANEIIFTINGLNDMYTETVDGITFRFYFSNWRDTATATINPTNYGQRLVVDMQTSTLSQAYIYGIKLYQVDKTSAYISNNDITTNNNSEYDIIKYNKQNIKNCLNSVLLLAGLHEPGIYMFNSYVNSATISDYSNYGFSSFIDAINNITGMETYNHHIIEVEKIYLNDRICYKQTFHYFYKDGVYKELRLSRLGFKNASQSSQTIISNYDISWGWWNQETLPAFPSMGSSAIKYFLEANPYVGYRWVTKDLPDTPNLKGNYALYVDPVSDTVSWNNLAPIALLVNNFGTAGSYAVRFNSSGEPQDWIPINNLATNSNLTLPTDSDEYYLRKTASGYSWYSANMWDSALKRSEAFFQATGLTGSSYTFTETFASIGNYIKAPLTIEGYLMATNGTFTIGSLTGIKCIPLNNYTFNGSDVFEDIHAYSSDTSMILHFALNTNIVTLPTEYSAQIRVHEVTIPTS